MNGAMLYCTVSKSDKECIDMLTEVQVRELLGELQDPFLHRSLTETNGITSVTIKEEKNHVSVKLAIAKTNTPEQMQLQMKVVDVLKGAGNAGFGNLVRLLAAHIFVLEHDFTGAGLVDAVDAVEQGGLAGAVGPDNGIDLALV